MIRKASLISGAFIFLLMIASFSLFRTSLYPSLNNTTLLRTNAEPTPKNEVYIPIVSSDNNRVDDLVDASNVGAISQPITAPVSGTVNPGEPEPFNLTPVPTVPVPGFEPVSAELDSIKFETIAHLEFTVSEMPFFGNISWSPDTTRFVGEFTSVISGTQVNQLYIGDTQTGQVSLWRQNASFPVWNRENNAIIYLKLRINDPVLELENGWSRNYYDLVMGSTDSETDETLLRDVIPPYFPLQQYVQTSQGNLLALDSLHRLVIWPSPAELVLMEKQGISPEPVADLSALVGISEPSQLPMFDETDPAFSISPSRSKAIVYRAGQPASLIDVMAAKVEGQVNNTVMPQNVAWSTNEKFVAFTNEQGVFLYDLDTKAINHLVSREDIGLAKEGTWGGFSSPAWAFDNQVILFMVSSSDWVKPGTEDRLEYYTLAITSDGKSRKAISDVDLISVSPSGSHAIIRTKTDLVNIAFQLVTISK